MDITLIITTKNRFFFVKRLLKYYHDLKFTGKILILDASDDIIFNKLSNIIKLLQGLKIKQIKSKLFSAESIADNLSFLDTEFVSWLGDDDYLIPNGIAECIQHLKNNNDLMATQGYGLMLGPPDMNKVPHISQVQQGLYLGPLRLEDKSSERFIKNYLDYKTPFFGVFRTENFKKVHGYCSVAELKLNCPYLFISDELLQSSLFLIFGKFDRIKTLHVIRCMHVKRQKSEQKILTRLSEEDKEKSKKFFVKKISAAINESENLSKEYLEKIARDCLNSLINFREYHKQSNFVILKKGIKKFLVFFSLLEFAVELKRNIFHRRELTIENLLKKENIYHKDFIYVYNSILSSYNHEDL